MAITHAFTSAKADGDDATLIRPSNWNADHDGTAADVPFTPTGTIAATNVQAAIEEVAAEAGGVTNPLTADLDVGGFFVRGADLGGDKGGVVQADAASEAGQGGDITVTGGEGNSTDGIGGEGTFEGGNGWQGGIGHLVGGSSTGDGQDGGNAVIEGGTATGAGASGGTVAITGGVSSIDGQGGDVNLTGGQSQGSGIEARISLGGRPATSGHGVVEVRSNGVTFNLKQAAFVANGSTVDQLRDALIAAGLMAAS